MKSFNNILTNLLKGFLLLGIFFAAGCGASNETVLLKESGTVFRLANGDSISKSDSSQYNPVLLKMTGNGTHKDKLVLVYGTNETWDGCNCEGHNLMVALSNEAHTGGPLPAFNAPQLVKVGATSSSPLNLAILIQFGAYINSAHKLVIYYNESGVSNVPIKYLTYPDPSNPTGGTSAGISHPNFSGSNETHIKGVYSVDSGGSPRIIGLKGNELFVFDPNAISATDTGTKLNGVAGSMLKSAFFIPESISGKAGSYLLQNADGFFQSHSANEQGTGMISDLALTLSKKGLFLSHSAAFYGTGNDAGFLTFSAGPDAIGSSQNLYAVTSHSLKAFWDLAKYGVNIPAPPGPGPGTGPGPAPGPTPGPLAEIMIPVPSTGTTISFPMGNNDDVTGNISHKFAIAQTEVTYELWHKVKTWATASARGANKYTFANAGREGHDGTVGVAPTGALKEPVTAISWRDAIVWSNAYTEWYNAEKGGSLTVVYYTDAAYGTPLRTSTNDTVPASLTAATEGSEDKPYIKANSNNNTDIGSNRATGFRLPTSIEWEFAARLRTNDTNHVTGSYASGVSINSITYYFTKGNSASGGSKAYNATDTDIGDFAWYNGNSSNKTHNVMGKTANALGIFDMSGNVEEWCFDASPAGAAIARVTRGGGWVHYSTLQVGDTSSKKGPNNVGDSLGFRVAQTLP